MLIRTVAPESATPDPVHISPAEAPYYLKKIRATRIELLWLYAFGQTSNIHTMEKNKAELTRLYTIILFLFILPILSLKEVFEEAHPFTLVH